MYARIAAGIVAELFDIPDDGPRLDQQLHPDVVARCFPVPSDLPVEVGWSHDGATFAPPAGPTAEVALANARAEAKGAAQAQLALRIAAGMAWSGNPLQIDDASQARLIAADALAQVGGLPDGITWRMADNTGLALDAAGLRAMAVAAGQHVYALRLRYWSLVDAIAGAADVSAVASIDVTSGWPG